MLTILYSPHPSAYLGLSVTEADAEDGSAGELKSQPMLFEQLVTVRTSRTYLELANGTDDVVEVMTETFPFEAGVELSAIVDGSILGLVDRLGDTAAVSVVLSAEPEGNEDSG